MSSEISQNSSFTVPSEMDEDIEVYIEYESEIYPLDKVTDYQSLCQKIEENLEGVKTQDLKITYKTPTGMVVTVKNNSTFTAARKKMKPEIKFTCTLNSILVTTAPIAAPSQPVNPQFQATEPWGTTPSTFSQQPPLQWPNENFSHPPSQQAADGPFDILPHPLTRSMTSTSYTQNPIQNQAEFPSVPSTSTVTHQPAPTFPGSAHQINLTPQMPYPYHSLTTNGGQQIPNQDTYPVSQLGQQANQMADAQIVIICLDDSGSMFNGNNDFGKAVAAGKELEQYLKRNHANPSQVHIQLWFNDCFGVNQVYKGQLSSTIPSNLWIRDGCQGDIELRSNSNPNFNYGQCGQFTGAVRILNQEVNSLLASSNYNSVYWFFFTDGFNKYPLDEMNELQKTMRCNRQRWTDNCGNNKLHPMIITNQLTVSSLCQMKVKIDEILKEIWQVEDACALKQNVKTDQLAETMIEKFTFS